MSQSEKMGPICGKTTRTKGHELHAAPDPEPTRIEFPGIEGLFERFWDEIPKPRFGPSHGE